jgi:hypothetical protein
VLVYRHFRVDTKCCFGLFRGEYRGSWVLLGFGWLSFKLVVAHRLAFSLYPLCIRNSKGAIVSQIEFKHTVQGFQRFDDERRKLAVPPSECLVAIETAYNLLTSSPGATLR